MKFVLAFGSFVLLILQVSLNSYSQESPAPETLNPGESMAGKLYFLWGYNRAYYNNSDIHFTGDGFDFTLEDARADDMPEKWDPAVYLNPLKLTVPQFNFRLGYYIDDKHSISLGWDHMKYKLVRDQLVKVNGYIDPDVFDQYAGEYNDQYIQLRTDFMEYEHSDGFNFVRAAIDRRELIYQTKKDRLRLTWIGGISAGLMFPWTDFTFIGQRYRNWIHLSGWAIAGQMTARVEFFKHFFVQAQAMWGYARLSDVIIMESSNARATQSVHFLQRSITGGAYIPIIKK